MLALRLSFRERRPRARSADVTASAHESLVSQHARTAAGTDGACQRSSLSASRPVGRYVLVALSHISSAHATAVPHTTSPYCGVRSWTALAQHNNLRRTVGRSDWNLRLGESVFESQKPVGRVAQTVKPYSAAGPFPRAVPIVVKLDTCPVASVSARMQMSAHACRLSPPRRRRALGIGHHAPSLLHGLS